MNTIKNKLLKHKGFTGSIEYSKQDGLYYGQVLKIEDMVNYEGISQHKLKLAFIEAVEDLISMKKQLGVKLHGKK